MKMYKNLFGVRTDFSIGESMLQVDDLVKTAKEKGYESIVLTDTMSVHAMVDFSEKCKKAGVTPIIGCRIRVVMDPLYRKPSKASGVKEVPNPMYFLNVYVKSEKGLQSLLRLLSKGNSADYFYWHSRVGINDVLQLEDVVVSTGDMFSVWHRPEAESIVMALATKFDTYIEISPIDTPLFDTLNKKAIAVAQRNSLPTLVTYPVMYKDDASADSLDILQCITNNDKVDSPWRSIQYVKDFSVQEPEFIRGKLRSMFGRMKFAMGSTDARRVAQGLLSQDLIIGACEYRFKNMPVSLPEMAPNEFLEMGKRCVEGWHKRFAGPVMGHQPTKEELDTVYTERLKYELGVIKKMGFSGYFLLVEDLVTWSKNSGILVGPGRGSVGGSLIAYLLGITDVDPIRFNLLFERFINPDRIDLPDADLDFMSSRRLEIIDYLSDKYGKDRVAGISNFSTLASASALRDVGRVFNMTGLELSATKLVPKEHGQSYTLTKAAESVPELEKFRDENKEVWEHSLRLEGAMRSFGQHAAGVVVAGTPLVNRAVVETRGEVPVVSWDKRVVENFGLVKMDILGLSTLDVLDVARRYIKERHGKDIDYLKIPLDDKAVMSAFGRGDTTGVFQFESTGMKKLLRDLATINPLTFEDITAATALYRPGPMDSGLMEDFVNIKKGVREPYYDHPSMKAALEATDGVIVYQEQVMQVAVDFAGFTRVEADHLRKAMGKKDKDKMAEMRQKWVDGCKATHGVDASLAGEIFDKIEAFAGYGFNRSHAVEYSIISVWTMWLRVNYPAEYFAASMSIVKEEKLPGLVKDARTYDIEVYPPDINLSTHQYVIPNDKSIIAPFSSVMGISENTAKRIVELRENEEDGKFRDYADFTLVAKQVGSKVNVKVVANLERVGAFAALEPSSPKARDPSRRKDQMELMPGLIIDDIKADRTTDLGEKFLRAKVITLIQEYKRCDGCDLASAPHPAVRAKTTVKYMVISDCPTWQEEKADKLLEGDSAVFVKNAIKSAGLNVGEGYYTTLVKAKKNGKMLSNPQINACSGFLDREIELLKPAVIIALGTNTIRKLLPGVKGGAAELAGQSFYDPKLDATIVCGINPQQILFDEDKQEVLVACFEKVAEILS